MKPQVLIALAIAIVCGLFAAVTTSQMLTPEQKAPEETIPVMVAARDISPGTSIDETMLKVVNRKKGDPLPEGVILAADKKELIGRGLRWPMYKEEIFSEQKLANPKAGSGIEILIPEGMRALAVKINTDRSVAGFIKPNSIVDILLTLRADGPMAAGARRTMTLLQKVKVIAINTDMEMDGSGSKGRMVEMVTFLVTPEEAEKLALAQSSGDISLVLRSGIDTEDIRSTGVDSRTLTGVKRGDEDKEKMLGDGPGEAILVQGDQKKGMFGMLKGLMGKNEKEAEDKKPETVEVTPNVPVAPVPAEPPVPPKKLRRVVFRDFQGNPLMEVFLPADSKMAETLKEVSDELTEADLLPVSAKQRENARRGDMGNAQPPQPGMPGMAPNPNGIPGAQPGMGEDEEPDMLIAPVPTGRQP